MTESNGTEEKKDLKSKIIIIILIILLILSLLFGGILLGILISGDDSFLTWLGITGSKQQFGGVMVDSGGYVKPEIDQTSQPGVAIPGWETIIFKVDGESTGSWNTGFWFYNPDVNNGMYKLQFELMIEKDGGGYTRYTTEKILPGYREQVVLNEMLAKNITGYNAVIHVQPYRINKDTPTNNAVIKTKIIVI